MDPAERGRLERDRLRRLQERAGAAAGAAGIHAIINPLRRTAGAAAGAAAGDADIQQTMYNPLRRTRRNSISNENIANWMRAHPRTESINQAKRDIRQNRNNARLARELGAGAGAGGVAAGAEVDLNEGEAASRQLVALLRRQGIEEAAEQRRGAAARLNQEAANRREAQRLQNDIYGNDAAQQAQMNANAAAARQEQMNANARLAQELHDELHGVPRRARSWRPILGAAGQAVNPREALIQQARIARPLGRRYGPVVYVPRDPDNRRRGRNQVRTVIKHNILQNVPGTFRPRGAIARIPGYRFGMCPVCLETIEEGEDGAHCLYHQHRCGLNRNDTLLNKYGAENGGVEFCFTCGRGTSHHGHFRLTQTDQPPDVLPIGYGGTYWNCGGSGGGNRREFIARLLGIIDYVNSLQDGQIENNKEFITACSFVAEAAAMDPVYLEDADESLRVGHLVREIRPDLGFGRAVPGEAPVGYEPADLPIIRRLGFFERISNRFREGLGGVFQCAALPAGQPAPARQPARLGQLGQALQIIPLPQCPAGRRIPEVMPLEDVNRANAACAICLEGERILYRFIHNNHARVEYSHTNDQLICRDCIVGHIRAKADSGTVECFIQRNDGCGGNIHPCELGTMLPEHQELFNRYFNVYRRVLGMPGGKRRTYKKYKGRKNKSNKK